MSDKIVMGQLLDTGTKIATVEWWKGYGVVVHPTHTTNGVAKIAAQEIKRLLKNSKYSFEPMNVLPEPCPLEISDFFHYLSC